MKLLHDSIYDPLKQPKRALWCFARLTINSVSGCFRRFSGKFLKKTERLKRCIRLFSWLENSRRKFGFHVFKPFLNISFRLSRPFFVDSVHHLPKPWSDQFTRVNSRKALCPKACDTASSHRYLPLGTFRQRAVRGECIPEYASYILSTLRGLVKCIVDRQGQIVAISLITC